MGQDVASYDLGKLTGRRVTHVKAAACEIDAERSIVRARGSAGRQELRFDAAIVAVGSSISTARVPGVAEHAHTIADAGAAARMAVALRHLPDGAVVHVVGGGLTGIEVASEIADRRPGLRVRLLCPAVFASAFSERGRSELVARLERLGVEVREDAEVIAVEPRSLTLAGGDEVGHDLVVWCAGFAVPSLLADSDLATDADGRLLVDAGLRSVSHPHVLGAGDAAAVPALPNGGAYRMSCQAGIPSGAHAADTVAAIARGRDPRPFDLGYLAWNVSLGRGDGVVQWVDRADRPKPAVLVGRRAALCKELATRGTVAGIRMERRVTGSLKWLSGGQVVAGLDAATA